MSISGSHCQTDNHTEMIACRYKELLINQITYSPEDLYDFCTEVYGMFHKQCGPGNRFE